MSLLSEALKPLFSDESMPNGEGSSTWRQYHGTILQADDALVASWLADESVPRPEHLRMLVDLIQQSPDTPRTTLLDLLDRQLVEVTPALCFFDEHDMRRLTMPLLPPRPCTLGSFMLSDLRDQFLFRWAALPWREQEKFYFCFSEQIAKAKG